MYLIFQNLLNFFTDIKFSYGHWTSAYLKFFGLLYVIFDVSRILNITIKVSRVTKKLDWFILEIPSALRYSLRGPVTLPYLIEQKVCLLIVY